MFGKLFTEASSRHEKDGAETAIMSKQIINAHEIWIHPADNDLINLSTTIHHIKDCIKPLYCL